MRKLCLVVLVSCAVLFSGCNKIETPAADSGISSELYFSTGGYNAKVSGDYLVLQEENLKIIDLKDKRLVKEINIPSYTLGYDIYGTKLVWSDLRNEKNQQKDAGYDETTNADIFMYDIEKDKTVQITTNEKTQISPKIWGNHIVWQDNRDDTTIDKNPEWDIYLYNIETKEEKAITTAPGIHTNPSISDSKVVWEDGRNFSGKPELRWGSNVPENNTDIFMYDIKTGKETPIAEEPLQECNPTIYGNYIAWEDRNNGSYAADIYLYDINKKERIKVTKDRYNQGDPKLFENYLIWMDERRGGSSNDVFVNGKAPNSDIFLYNINEKKEYLMTGDGPQIMPSISSNYIAYILSSQVRPEVQVIKYR